MDTAKNNGEYHWMLAILLHCEAHGKSVLLLQKNAAKGVHLRTYLL